MRRPGTAGGLLFVALCTATVGCFWKHTGARATIAERLDSASGTGLVLNTRLIEQSAGDLYLNDGIWAATNRPFGHEQTSLLARNGLRVGVLDGMIPPEFTRLAHSEAHVVSPMMRTATPGSPKVVPVNGPLDQCSYQVIREMAADAEDVELTAAECGLSVTATPLEGGRVKLTCEFQVQHGEKQAWLRASADGSSFVRHDSKPLESYPTLSFTVTVEPDDYVLVGASDDPLDRLGQAFFFTGSGDRLRQRVLVIRAGTK